MKPPLAKRFGNAVNYLVSGRLNKVSLLNKIDLFSPVIYEDYCLVRESIPALRPEYVSWNSGTLEADMVKGVDGVSLKGRNILLGNSASDTNNHLDAFEALRKLDLDGRKIITPLSYGNANYRNVSTETRYRDLWQKNLPH